MWHKFFQYWQIETETLKLWIPVAFAAGCLIYFLLPVEPSLYWGMAFFVFGTVIIVGIRCYATSYLGLYQLGWSVTLVAAGFCLAWIQTHQQSPFYQVPTRSTMIQGQVKTVEYLPSGKRRLGVQHVRFLIAPEMDQQEWQRLIVFTLSKNDHQSIQTGNWIKARVLLQRPYSPQIVGGYDLQFKAWFSNIGAYGYALQPIQIISKQSPKTIRSLRENIAYHIRQQLPNSSGVIAQILLTGMSGELPASVRHDFAASGLAHLLAIAGLHLGIVMGTIGYITRWLLLRSQYLTLYLPVKEMAIVTGWLSGCGYLILTGLHLPAMRSLIMASVVVIALLYKRLVISKHNLMLAALFLLLLSPASVLDVSFQMSMAAVMALVSGYRCCSLFVTKWAGYEPSIRRFCLVCIIEPAIVSILAGTAVVPIIMTYFHEIDLYFIFANIIAVPLTALWIMPLGLLALCMMPLGFDSPFLQLMAWGIKGVIILAKAVSGLPYASISIPYFPPWRLALYFLGLCMLCLCVTKLRWCGLGIILISLVFVFWSNKPDILTAANGRMIGIRQENQLIFLCQGGCDRITKEQWQLVLGLKNVTTIPSNSIASCNDKYCYFFNQKILATFKSIDDLSTRVELCRKTVLEVSFLWGKSSCADIITIDKQSNWTSGAHSIWLNPLLIQNDLENRGKRPWVMEPIQRGMPNMPVAQTE
ncbi:ComEC/Rec2 family competence protein [Commensalibacter oyaizuii]|uniref:ComEC/Rec2 family competence protein n=1 Tax=Commensalibacter oyaizuii TaxID=3043873 RepID=A0ABT6Q1Z2_9PROT|nr:ComEC/Rec2 family competence protein [Commensalibacter sp. TBRC 16381]MDI2090509.1 ComEC/Rec2 family competence protein [Commensalibacter sp. TBRC 16381]